METIGRRGGWKKEVGGRCYNAEEGCDESHRFMDMIKNKFSNGSINVNQ